MKKNIIVISAIVLVLGLVIAGFFIWNKTRTFYMITLDLDGGTLDETEIKVYAGEDYQIPSPKKERSHFIGWFTEDGEMLPSLGKWNIQRDVTLKAKWKETHLITLESGGGRVANTTIEVAAGFPYSIPTPDRKNSVFLGWFTEDGEAIASTGTWKKEEDLTLVAKWNIVYNGMTFAEKADHLELISFDGDFTEHILIPASMAKKPVTKICEGAFQGSTDKIDHNSLLTYTISIPKSVSYIGKNAFNKCEGIKVVLFESNNGAYAKISELERTVPWTESIEIEDGNTQFEDVITGIRETFGSELDPNADYLVRLDANGGTVSRDYLKIKYQAEYTLYTPKRDGYVFKGWYCENSFVANSSNFNGNQIVGWRYAKHVTLIAKWEELK